MCIYYYSINGSDKTDFLFIFAVWTENISYKRTLRIIAEDAKINRHLMTKCYETIRQILGDWRKKTACLSYQILQIIIKNLILPCGAPPNIV